MGIHENNGGCELPCWWGITPGETSWQEVHQRFSPLGRVRISYHGEEITSISLLFDIPEDHYFYNSNSIHSTSLVEREIVQLIFVESLLVEPTFDESTSGLLARFGLPEDIWMKISVDQQ